MMERPGPRRILEEYDFNDIARRIAKLKKRQRLGDYSLVAYVLSELGSLPFPPGYLDSVRDEMFCTLRTGGGTPSMTSVYLAFYGLEDRASHLKIGIAKDVRSRLSNIKTGNPLPNLWTYTAPFPNRKYAAAVESALLSHMSKDSAHGEWINLGGISDQAAEAIVASLADVATEIHGDSVQFHRFKVWI